MTTPAGDPDKTARIDTDARYAARQRGQDEQFAPGTLVADRYRIASLLGSGGMGEVYRADDTKLGVAVALKFLPARFARDPILLGRLHDEVRLGRQISHPNVCRIYDIIDWQGSTFVAMEYVDGEDLSRLLRRIGRLAHDKAVDITRGIAAGLMAAHAKGILHRDLKPANVMIDSRGDAHIMDFGLALVAGDDDGMISGTPAYMAPELLEGRSATVQSDLYALGLVMYELFTGKRAHTARTLNERAREISSDITTPSDLIRDIDPAVERIILRCLANDPAQRPASARAVIEALPGGDPLAAALAAGELLSPRVVAAAGAEGSLSRRTAWTLLLSMFVLIALILAYAYDSRFLDLIGLTSPPEVQVERASQMLKRFGIPEGEFRSSGFELNRRHFAWLYTETKTARAWEGLRRGLPVATFWMRSDSAPLANLAGRNATMVHREEPPQLREGAVTIELDPRGGLFSLSAVPSESWKARPIAWNDLLTAAQLDVRRLKPTPPTFAPPAFADARASWSGTHPEDGTPIRVDAAAFRGTPVFFRIRAPWDETDRRAEVPFAAESSFHTFMFALMLSVIFLGSFLAWRNLRLRRGDRQGALRLATAVLVLSATTYFGLAEHAAVPTHELRLFFQSVAMAMVEAALAALIYLALEPYIRRRWPDRLIGWTRLLAGKWRDPMVGRDILAGLVAGGTFTAVSMGGNYVRTVLTGKLEPHDPRLDALGGPLSSAIHVLNAFTGGIVYGFAFVTLLMVLTIVLRRRALAVTAFFIVTLSGFLLATTDPYLVPGLMIAVGTITFTVARQGLLATVAMFGTFFILFFVPLPEGIAWATTRVLVAPAFIAALAVWAFRTSLGGQSPFAGSLLDE